MDRSSSPASVTADPNKANWGRLPTWAYAVVPIATVVPVPTVPVIVVMIMSLIVSVMLILVVVLILIVVLLPSEGRYWK
jgi:hypothetical protein